MINHYLYFLALAEEKSITKAAEKLFVSHQALSRYLKNLENEYHINLFERTPNLKLTAAGQSYLDMVRQIQMLEDDLNSRFEEIRQEQRGILRFGTTEGRYRILVPLLLTEFHKAYPNVTLEVQYGTIKGLSTQVTDNALDIALLNQTSRRHSHLEFAPVVAEKMYLVVSDTLLKQYFPDDYEARKERYAKGVDLKEFVDMPFVTSIRDYNSRKKLDEYLQFNQVNLNIVLEVMQSDLHYLMTAHDYAASFCWSMYVPSIHEINLTGAYSYLNIFPLKDCDISNHLMAVTREGRILPQYGEAFMQILKRTCQQLCST